MIIQELCLNLSILIEKCQIMDYISDFSNNHRGSLRLDYLPCVNYSMLLNKVNTCNLCEVENKEEIDWRAVKVEVMGDFLKPSVQFTDCVPAGQRVQLAALKIEPMPDKLLKQRKRAMMSPYQVELSLSLKEQLPKGTRAMLISQPRKFLNQKGQIKSL